MAPARGTRCATRRLLIAQSTSTTDQIRKDVFLRAPRSRVWQALSDATRFGEWFGVRFEGPFRAGERVRGQMTKGDCSSTTFDIWIDAIEPETRFSFRWHPHAVDPDVDYSHEPTTLVEFQLADEGEGTALTLIESGFDAIPESRRAKAFGMNDGGWTHQAKALQEYVGG